MATTCGTRCRDDGGADVGKAFGEERSSQRRLSLCFTATLVSVGVLDGFVFCGQGYASSTLDSGRFGGDTCGFLGIRLARLAGTLVTQGKTTVALSTGAGSGFCNGR